MAPGSQSPEDAVQNPPVIHPLHPTRLLRQKRGNHRPLEIRQIKSGHGALLRLSKVNHSTASLGIPLMSMDLVHVVDSLGPAAMHPLGQRGLDELIEIAIEDGRRIGAFDPGA